MVPLSHSPCERRSAEEERRCESAFTDRSESANFPLTTTYRCSLAFRHGSMRFLPSSSAALLGKWAAERIVPRVPPPCRIPWGIVFIGTPPDAEGWRCRSLVEFAERPRFRVLQFGEPDGIPHQKLELLGSRFRRTKGPHIVPAAWPLLHRGCVEIRFPRRGVQLPTNGFDHGEPRSHAR